MQLSDRDRYIIETYTKDEKMMILMFAQWCVNNGIDAHKLYKKAYPNQPKNEALVEALEKTEAKEESISIPLETLQTVLQLFGNDDLAFVVQEAAEQCLRKKSEE